MDFFKDSLPALITCQDFNAPNAAQLKRLKDICFAMGSLRYGALEEKSLNLLAELFITGGHVGEAYRAVMLVPEERRVDRAGIIPLIEAPRPRPGSLSLSL
jgi:hypothetical protein